MSKKVVSLSYNTGVPLIVFTPVGDDCKRPNEGIVIVNPSKDYIRGFFKYPIAITLNEVDVKDVLVSVETTDLTKPGAEISTVEELTKLLSEKSIPAGNLDQISDAFSAIDADRHGDQARVWNLYERKLAEAGLLPITGYEQFVTKPVVDISELCSELTSKAAKLSLVVNFDKAMEDLKVAMIKGVSFNEALVKIEEKYGEMPFEFYQAAKEKGLL